MFVLSLLSISLIILTDSSWLYHIPLIKVETNKKNLRKTHMGFDIDLGKVFSISLKCKNKVINKAN